MTTVDRLRRRTAAAVATVRYAASRRSSIRYLGWLGQRNLGDEAVHQALAHYFAPRSLAWRPDRPPARLERLARPRRHDLTVLGGGTLIGGRYLVDLLAEPRPERRAVFGAGVIDPDFPHSYRQGADALDRWVDALGDVGLLGVRGPRSRALLGDRGIDAPVLGDPVARFVQPEEWRAPSGTRTIGINVGHSGGAVWGSELAMLATLSAMVRSLAERGWTVEFYVVWPPDLPVTRMVMADSGSRGAVVHQGYDRADRFLASVRHLDAFVGVKLHAVALATCAGVPAAAIEYHPKCRDFMASIDLDRLAVRSDELDVAGLLDVVDELESDGPVIAKTARTRLVDFRARQQAAADVLLHHISRN